MKKVFYKALSLFMALIVLTTTMSFTVGMHYCADTLVDVALFQQAKSCGMEKTPTAQPSHQHEAKTASCCSEKNWVVDGQDTYKESRLSLSLEQQVFITAFTYTYVDLFSDSNFQEPPYIIQAPPLIQEDLHIAYQHFLI